MGMENDPSVTEAIVWEGPVSSSMIVVGSTVYFGGNPMIPVKHEKRICWPLKQSSLPSYPLVVHGGVLIADTVIFIAPPKTNIFPENQHILLKWSLFGGWI